MTFIIMSYAIVEFILCCIGYLIFIYKGEDELLYNDKWKNKYYFLPTVIHKNTKVNWFGAIIISLFFMILFHGWVICMFLYWLFHIGRCDTEDYNTEKESVECENIGIANEGSYNTGNYNIGNYNTGDWNIGDHNTGCFNTKRNTIMLFNKPSNLTYDDWLKLDAKFILDDMPMNIKWVDQRNMTEEEKSNHPDYKTKGGYFKIVNVNKTMSQFWYNKLSKDEQKIIKSIPNFDADIFHTCTGIKV